VVKGLDRLPGGPELADEGVNEPPMGGDEALIEGQGDGRLDGVEARRDHIRRAPMGLANAGLQGSAAGQWGSLQGWPAAENGTHNDRVCVLTPGSRLRDIVVQGARATSGEPHVVSTHAPAVVDEWCQGTPGGARRIAGLPRVAVSAEPFERPFGGGGVIRRAAGGQRVAGPCEGQGVDGTAPEDVVCAPGQDEGAFGAFEADGDRLSRASRLQGTHPCLKGFWGVVETAGLWWRGARSLSANIRCGSGPVEADEGRTCFGRCWRHG